MVNWSLPSATVLNQGIRVPPSVHHHHLYFNSHLHLEKLKKLSHLYNGLMDFDKIWHGEVLGPVYPVSRQNSVSQFPLGFIPPNIPKQYFCG